MEGNFTITKERYIELLVKEEILRRLECGGVDNWDWYGEALNPADEMDLDDFEKELRKALT